MTQAYRMVINGRSMDALSGETFEVRNPANTDEVVGLAPLGSREDVRMAVEAAISAVKSSCWSPMYESRRRAAVMRRFIALVDAQRDTLARLFTREQGKIYRESLEEVEAVIDTFDYFAGYAGKIAGEVQYVRDGDAIIKVETRKQPVGICAAILPFNFPVGHYAWKVAPALMAGNAIIIKPASATPLVDILLTALLQEAGAPPGIVSIVTGPADIVGDELLRHPAIRRISFTGSTEVGRLIAAAAAPAFKRVTLELGGCDPTVVAADADLEAAAETIVRHGRFRNAGQSCTAVKRLYVFDSVFDQFVDVVTRKTAALRVGDGLAPHTDMGPLNNAATLASVERLLDDALKHGGTATTGGQRLTDGAYAKGYFLEPTVLVDVSDAAAIWNEECFGPVLPMTRVRDLDEAIARANASRYGLGAVLWSQSDHTIERFAMQIESGIVWINYKPLTVLEAPFGGIKDSGIGRELAAEGLAEYLEIKSVQKFVGRA